MNNIKQQGLAVSYYTDDWDEIIPTIGTNLLLDEVLIIGSLNFYLSSPDSFWCPTTDPALQWDGVTNLTLGSTTFTYGYNGLGTDSPSGTGFFRRSLALDEPIRMTEIERPSQCITIADSSLDNRPFEIANIPTAPLLLPGGRHNGGSNVGFADGHVQWMSLGQLAADENLWRRR